MNDEETDPLTADAPTGEEETKRKDKVLHTRVPAVLDEELRRLAEALRVPVSNVVRSILQDAVQTVDAVSVRAEDEVRGFADLIRSQRERRREPKAPEPPLASVVGYQPMMLAKDTNCVLCGASLPAGSQAFLGIQTDVSSPTVIVGPECLPFERRP